MCYKLQNETTVTVSVLSNQVWISMTNNMDTVGYATTNDATMNECYNKQFLSVKSGSYNEHRCYNERGGILSADVACTCA
jgi:hypothetical protein